MADSATHQAMGATAGESWFATLKEELIHRQSWATISQVRRAVTEFIEIFYNHQRLHSSLGYLTPVEYKSRSNNTPAVRRHNQPVRQTGATPVDRRDPHCRRDQVPR
jgi:hypothetical protein